MVNYIKGRKGMFASCNWGLLSVGAHLLSCLHHDHNAYLFGVSRCGVGGNKQCSAAQNCVGFAVKQIFTQMLKLEMRRRCISGDEELGQDVK